MGGKRESERDGERGRERGRERQEERKKGGERGREDGRDKSQKCGRIPLNMINPRHWTEAHFSLLCISHGEGIHSCFSLFFFKFFYMQIFSKTSLTELRRKSVLLTGYLEALVKQEYSRPEGKSVEEDGQEVYIDILTPSDPAQRGAQLSLAFNINVGQVFQELEKRGVVVSTEAARDFQYRVGQWGRFEIHW